jgi:nicotinamide riboside kinase
LKSESEGKAQLASQLEAELEQKQSLLNEREREIERLTKEHQVLLEDHKKELMSLRVTSVSIVSINRIM